MEASFLPGLFGRCFLLVNLVNPDEIFLLKIQIASTSAPTAKFSEVSIAGAGIRGAYSRHRPGSVALTIDFPSSFR